MARNQAHNRLIILIVLAGLSLAISLYSWRAPRAPIDLYISLWFQSFDNPALRVFMTWVSYLYSGWWLALIIVAAGLIMWRRIGWLEAIMVPAAGIVSLFDTLIKLAVNRPRPSSDLVQVFVAATLTGFPSGHAFSAVVILGMMLYLILRLVSNHNLRVFLWIIFPLLILLIGVSRIFLGVHWPSDVIGGYIIGSLFLVLLIWLYERLKEHYGTSG